MGRNVEQAVDKAVAKTVRVDVFETSSGHKAAADETFPERRHVAVNWPRQRTNSSVFNSRIAAANCVPDANGKLGLAEVGKPGSFSTDNNGTGAHSRN